MVEALSFCPYAARAREDGRTREVVVLEAVPTDATAVGQIELIAADARIEIGLVLLPRLEVSRKKLGRWVEVLRKQHAGRHGGTPILAIEGFHPDAEADTSSPERLTPFVRRTPDPTLQLTRLDALEKVRRGTPTGTAFVDPSAIDLDALRKQLEKRPLHERIAELNLETVERRGVEAIEAIVQDILRDRDRAYAELDPDVVRRAST